MGAEQLRNVWTTGGVGFGAWISMREPLLAEAAGRMGYDYVCVDMQHGLAEYSDALSLITAIAEQPTTPIVRVPWNEPGIIGRVLDAGARGVIIPMVNTPEEARAAVAACRYAPEGSRSYGPTVAGVRFGSRTPAQSNAEVLCICMIETKQAIENLDAILDVPGIDATYVGPADLSISLGLPPATDNPEPIFQDALAAVVEGSNKRGIVPGVHCTSHVAPSRVAQGFRMITISNDVLAAQTEMRADLARARNAKVEQRKSVY